MWDGKATNFGAALNLKISSSIPPPYVYLCSNETIQGVQFHSEIDTWSVPLVCDASSDFLHRPLPIRMSTSLRLCPEECRLGRRDGGDHPR